MSLPLIPLTLINSILFGKFLTNSALFDILLKSSALHFDSLETGANLNLVALLLILSNLLDPLFSK